jgi:hypothetical protein
MTKAERLDKVADAIADLSEAWTVVGGLLDVTDEQADEMADLINGVYLMLARIEPTEAKPLPKELTNLLG